MSDAPDPRDVLAAWALAASVHGAHVGEPASTALVQWARARPSVAALLLHGLAEATAALLTDPLPERP